MGKSGKFETFISESRKFLTEIVNTVEHHFKLADELKDQIRDCKMDDFEVDEIRNHGYTAVMKRMIKPNIFSQLEAQYMYVYLNQDRDVIAEMHGIYDPAFQIKTAICSNPKCNEIVILTDNENIICDDCIDAENSEPTEETIGDCQG